MQNVCVEPSCTYATRLVPDKDLASVRHSLPDKSVIYLYPSKRCPSGLCHYHFTKRYFAKLGPGRQS